MNNRYLFCYSTSRFGPCWEVFIEFIDHMVIMCGFRILFCPQTLEADDRAAAKRMQNDLFKAPPLYV